MNGDGKCRPLRPRTWCGGISPRGKRFDTLTSIRRVARTANVREPIFELGDGRRRYRLSAVEFRRMFPGSILSYQFEPALADGQLIIDGRGHGHGVGLCQWVLAAWPRRRGAGVDRAALLSRGRRGRRG